MPLKNASGPNFQLAAPADKYLIVIGRLKNGCKAVVTNAKWRQSHRQKPILTLCVVVMK